MQAISDLITGLNPFWQSILASAVFSLALWLGRKLWKFIGSFSHDVKINYDIRKIQKHYIHKHYVNTSGLAFFSQGYLHIITEALKHLLVALMILSFYWGVSSVLAANVLGIVFSYFVFSSLWEARSWLIDSSSEEVLKGIDPAFVKEALAKLPDPREKYGLPTEPSQGNT